MVSHKTLGQSDFAHASCALGFPTDPLGTRVSQSSEENIRSVPFLVAIAVASDGRLTYPRPSNGAEEPKVTSLGNRGQGGVLGLGWVAQCCSRGHKVWRGGVQAELGLKTNNFRGARTSMYINQKLRPAAVGARKSILSVRGRRWRLVLSAESFFKVFRKYFNMVLCAC